MGRVGCIRVRVGSGRGGWKDSFYLSSGIPKYDIVFFFCFFVFFPQMAPYLALRGCFIVMISQSEME